MNLALHSAVSELVYVRGWIARVVQYPDGHLLSDAERDALAAIRCIWRILGLLEPGVSADKPYAECVSAVDALTIAAHYDEQLQPTEKALLALACVYLRTGLSAIEQERTQ